MEKLIEELEKNGVSIIVDEDKLKIIFDEDKEIPEHFLQELKDKKTEMIAFLKQEKNALEFPSDNNEYPCSPNQRSLYFNYKKDISSSSYNMTYINELKEIVDVNRFNNAINEVVKRHEALRTCFVERNNQLKQIIVPVQDSKLEVVLFNYETYDEDEVVKTLRTEAQKRFNLEEGYPLRVVLVQTKSRSLVLLSLHHIVGDLLSLKIIAQEIYEIYLGNKVNFHPLNQHYKDYCVWLEKKLTDTKEAETMWLEKFSNLETTTRLQNDLNLSIINPTVKYANHSFPKLYLKTFKKICQENNSSFYVGFSSLVSLLLNKITDTKDIIFGSPVTARHLLNHQDQVGYYVNTIPIRIKIDDEISFIDFLKRNKNNINECINHSYYPLPYLIKNLQKNQENIKELFNILVVYQNQEEFEESEFVKKIYDKLQMSAKYDLIIEFSDIISGDINIKIEYNESLYSADYINVIYKALFNLIENICKEPQKKLRNIDLINDADREQLLVQFNDTKFDYPKDKTIIDFFKNQVRQFPEKIALKDDTKSYSYSELDKLSGQIAAFIVEKFGSEDKSPIALLLNRSVNLIAVLLGIFKTGRSYIPIDSSFPKDRLNYIIADCQTNIIFCESNFEIEGDTEITKISIENIFNQIDRYSPKDFQVVPEDTAYIIYTSGSTGAPKGVEISHQSLLNFLISIQNKPGICTTDILFSITTYSFDISILEFFGPLISGATLYIANQNLLTQPNFIIDKIQEIKPTIIQATPSFYQILFNANWLGNKKLKVLCGGDSLNDSLAEKLIMHNLELWNMYGPTETTIWSSCKKIEYPSQASNIGSPINNTKFYILDEFFNPKPIGMQGAIYISGDGLAKGYFNNKTLTQEKFIQNPFDPTDLCYQTGDVGKWNSDGEIEFSGRSDFQVKIRGYRIELNEIDHVITNLTYIKTSKTLYEKNKLICYFISENQQTCKDEDIETIIRKDIKLFLPDYMIPHLFIEIESIPTTINGKLDRNKLLQQQKVRKEQPSHKIVNNEEKILSIWAEVLDTDIKNIVPSKNFFENGGDSLSLLNLISKLNNIGIHITYDAFIEAPFLANIINNVIGDDITPVQLDEKPFILSPIQEWYFEKNPSNANFLMYTTHTLEENYSAEMIQIALNAICQKHSSFRLRYTQNLFWHQYYDTEALTEQLYVFKDLGFEKDKNLENCIEEAEQIIDTQKGPLLYVTLFKHNEETAIFFTCPHLIIDAVSWNIFINDFVYYYNNPSLKPTYTKTYKEWLLNHLNNSNGNINKEEINYWIEQASDKNIYRKGFITQNRMENLNIPNVDVDKSSKNIENIILTALTFTIGKTFQFDDVYFEKEGHGREMVNKFDSSEIIGWFTSKYPVKYTTNRESLVQTYHNVVNANENRRYNGVWFDKYKRLAPQPIRNALNKELSFSFNYLGVFSQSNLNSFPLAKPLIPLSTHINSEYLKEIRKKFYLLEVNCGVIANEIFINLNATERLCLNDEEWNSFKELLNESINTLMEYSKNDPKDLSDDDGSLSDFQKELIAHSLINEDKSENYIIQWEFEIKNADRVKLRNSCRDLLNKFEILRTAYFYDVQRGIFRSEVLNLEDAFIFNEYSAVNNLKEKLKQLKNIAVVADKSLIKFSLINIDIETDIFVISAHHALLDGHSMFILLHELLNTYEDKSVEKHYVPYKKYIQHIRSKDKKVALNYWKTTLSMFLKEKVTTNLNNNATFNEHSVAFKISKETQDTLRSNKLTLSSAFNFIFGNTYALLKNEEKLVWGNVVNYRTNEMENMDGIVGPCINSIPVCFDFKKPGTTLFDDIAILQKQVITSQQFSYISLQEIVTTVGQKKLFDILFTYQNYKKAELDSMNLQIQMLNENIISSHFPLTVVVHQVREYEFGIRVKYNTAFYTEDFIQNFIKVYTDNMEKLECSQAKTALSVIKGEYKQKMPFKSLIEGFELWVKKSPDKIALSYVGEELTYRELDENANFICSQLMDYKGINCVVVCLSNVQNYVPAIIGILKTGLHFINIDASFSQKTIEKIILQLEPSVLITDNAAENLDPFFTCENRINLQQGIGKKSAAPTINRENQELVTINYTSGSTGVPKLVKIDNKSHLNRLNWLLQNFPATTDDQYVLKSSFSFAPALREVFEPLCQGSTLHIINNNMLKNVDEFCLFMKKNKITRIFLTPSYIKLLIANNKLVDLKEARIIEVSGESYSHDLVGTLNKVLPNTIILNRYGCTEAASVVYHTFSKELPISEKRIPSGKPIYNTEIIVCNEEDQIVPIGVIGTILIKSDCLSLGYVNAEANKNKFIEREGTMWLNTEDLGYIGEDGNLYYVSRGTRMVKIRGYRVELDELEVIAKNHPDIKNAYADVETNEYGNFIVFYYSSFSKKPIGSTELKEYFAGELPEYAIPHKYVFISVFPLTLNGKIDAQELKKMSIPILTKDQNTPLDKSLEKSIENILKELLKIEEDINPMDDFRSLGLDSILSLYFLHKLHNVLGIKSDPILLYKNNTIRLFANALNSIDNQAGYSIIKPESKHIVFVITPASDAAIDFQFINEILTYDYNLVIFDPVRLDKETTVNMETLAMHYAKEINDYLSTIIDVESVSIAGWSLGATIAYEVSALFKKENVVFDHLMLIDPGFYYQDYDDQVTRTSLTISLEKLDPEKIFTDRYIDAALKANQLIRNYNPKKLDRKIILVKPKTISSFERNYNHKLNQLDEIGNTTIELLEINGNHMTMMQNMEGILELFNQIIHNC
jgi:amino acid adenylation domain-containing protein